MRSSVMATPGRGIPKPPNLEIEHSDVSLCTPRPTSSREPIQSRTCFRGPRALNQLQSSMTTIKRRMPSMMSDSVKVFVRVKPVMEDDLKSDRNQVAVAVHEKENQLGITLPAGNGKEHWFADFDGVLHDATNQDVFEVVGRGLLDQYLNGINVSIMAYGQTGSGKTYSMFGRDHPNGKVQGLLQLIIRHIDENVCIGTRHTDLSMSVFEVYHEDLWCLLDAKSGERRLLPGKFVEYLTHEMRPVGSADEAIQLAMEALQKRTEDFTARNANSSRSHAIVKLRLVQHQASLRGPGTESIMFIVDLAGSESILQASSSAQAKETISINASLGALERVVNSLSKRCDHVPFRDHLLTLVLQDGLKPHKARVALLTTISPFQRDLAVTKSTLNFAQRARNIRTFAQVNAAPKRQAQTDQESVLRQLQELQAINNTLKEKLAELNGSTERLARERYIEALGSQLQRLMEVHAELQRTSAAQQQEAEAALEQEREDHALTRAQLAEVRRAHAALTVSFAAAEDEARAAAAGLRAQLAEAMGEAAAETTRLNGELAFSRALTEEVQSQHRDAQEQLAQAREQLTQLKGQMAQLREQLAVSEASGGQLAQQMEHQMSQLRAEANMGRSAALAEASALRQRLHELTQELESARQDATHSSQELQDARQQAACYAEELAQMRTQATCYSEELQDTQQQVSRLSEELQQTRQQAACYREEAEQARQQATCYSEELEQTRKQAACYREDVERTRQEAGRLEDELERAREVSERQALELEQAREELSSLQARGSDTEKELASLRQRLEAAEQQTHEQAAIAEQLRASLREAAAAASNAASVAVAVSEGHRIADGDTVVADAGNAARPGAHLGVDGVWVGMEAPALPAVSQLQETLRQLGACTEQLAAMEEELAAAKEQLDAAESEKGSAVRQLYAVRGSTQAEIEVLREQLVEQTAVLSRQANAHSVALAAAVKEVRAASEASAAQRLVPLQTEVERLRATAALSEQQMERLQAECEQLREEGGAAAEELARLRAECERLREAAGRAEAESSERAAKQLEAQREAAGLRPEMVKQLQDRVRQLEAENANQKGRLELRDKLYRQLELMNHQLQSEVNKLKDGSLTTQLSAELPASGTAAANSPFSALANSDSRCDAVSPAPAGDSTPVSSASAAPAAGAGRGATSGILLLGRTTTGSAAALARNTKALRAELSTPPPQPRFGSSAAPPAATPSPVAAPAASAAASAANNMASPPPAATPSPQPKGVVSPQPPATLAPQVIDVAATPTEATPAATTAPPAEVIDLVTTCATPGPPELRLTPINLPPLDDGYVVVARRHREQKAGVMSIFTNAYRNQVNY